MQNSTKTRIPKPRKYQKPKNFENTQTFKFKNPKYTKFRKIHQIIVLYQPQNPQFQQPL